MLNKKRSIPLDADAAAVPQPRQLRRLGRRAQPLAGREGRGGRRLHPVRDRRRRSCSSRTASCRRRAHGRQGARQGRRREGQLRARLRRHRQGDRARRGLLGPPDRRRAARASTSPPRTRRSGRSASRRSGRSSSRSTRSSTRSAGRCARRPSTRSSAAPGSTDEPRGRDAAGLDRLRRRPRLGRRAPLRPRRAPGVQAAPAGAQDPRGRQARRLGREGDPRGRLLGDAQAARAGHGDLRRLRRHGQRARAQGHPLRDQVGDARGGDDLPRAEGRLERLLAYEQAVYDSEIGKDLYAVAQHEAAVRQGPDRRRRDRERDGGHARAASPAATGRRTATPSSR